MSGSEPASKLYFLGPRFRRRALVSALVLSILFGDHLVGLLYFKYRCRDAGEHINYVVDGVAGFWWHVGARETAPTFGYQFIETGRTKSTVTRYTVENGGIREERDVPPISRYSADLGPIEYLALSVTKQEYRIADKYKAEDVAIYRIYTYGNGWLVRFISGGFSNTEAQCPSKPFASSAFVTSVLRPTRGN